MATAVNTDYKLAPNNDKLDHIPGSFGWPIIGHTFPLVKDLYGTIDKQYKEFGPVSRFGLAGFDDGEELIQAQVVLLDAGLLHAQVNALVCPAKRRNHNFFFTAEVVREHADGAPQ